ncbi:MAG: hypothetical protein V1934_00410 [Methanobacteriota archaeon]
MKKNIKGVGAIISIVVILSVISVYLYIPSDYKPKYTLYTAPRQIQSRFISSSPTIDGKLGQNEWDYDELSQIILSSNFTEDSLTCQYIIQNINSTLFLLFRISDDTYGPLDIYIDNRNDNLLDYTQEPMEHRLHFYKDNLQWCIFSRDIDGNFTWNAGEKRPMPKIVQSFGSSQSEDWIVYEIALSMTEENEIILGLNNSIGMDFAYWDYDVGQYYFTDPYGNPAGDASNYTDIYLANAPQDLRE